MDSRTTEYIKARINAEYQRAKERGGPPEDFEGLPDIPVARYIDPEFFALEQEHVWSKSWLLAAHSDELPDVGSYLLWERSGVSILIVRGVDNRIRAFYNTCAHRGGPLVRQAAGRERVFVCKYHCWAYTLDGELSHIPDEHEFVGIDKRERGLKPVRCEQLGNLVFINRDLDAIPLVDYLGPMVGQLRDFEPEHLKFVTSYSLDVAANWKIMVDAFLEVYHLKHIHPTTVHKSIDYRGTTISLFSHGHSRMAVPMKTGAESFVSVPGSSSLDEGPEQEIARSTSLAFHLFPNVVTPLSAVSFPFLLFWPVSRDRTRLEVIFYTRGQNADADSLEWQQRIDGFNVILGEDVENLGWIQRSIDSGGLDGIPLSYQERRIYHFHEFLDETIGIADVPASLRVEPRLARLREDR
jgi:phenylpropionate dioxygenase-like ring-hydroxylating dioxygenase large terminal subunit